MKSEQWEQIDQLLQSALAREPVERPAFLAVACAGDESLRQEVESLIVAHEQPGQLLETPLPKIAADLLITRQAPRLDGQALGHYRVLNRLGAGAMGEVYLAQDTRLGRKVALKLLPVAFTKDETRVRRFEQEARAASALNHPNIITIHEIGETDDLHFIATEFIDGQTLRQRLTTTGMKLSEALDVATQAAGALAAAHEAGIVHRDVKPENIMLRSDGYIKVLDFGLAKLTERHVSDEPQATGAEFQTEPGTVMGTARYMSPEQARGLGVDARTDIFSLGVVLYEMIAGRPPFEGPTTSDVISAILKEEPTPLRLHRREAPLELDWMVKKALAKNQEERYQTIRELQIDLKRLKQELEVQSKLHGMSPRSLEATTETGGGTAVDFMKAPRVIGGAVSRFKAIAVGAIAIAIFSIVSFYIGLMLTPSEQPEFRQLTFRRGVISTARFTPDGQTIIYSAAFDANPVELFTSRIDSSESSPVNLPVGRRIVSIQSISSAGEMAILLDCELDFGKCRNGTLARVMLAGGAPREVIENVYEADWSPDGKDLAMIRIVEGEYQLEYKGKVLYKAPGRISDMRVSPKGDLVAFIDHPFLDEDAGSVMIADINGQTKTLSAGLDSTNGLAWSPTGKEVWFSGARHKYANALNAVTTSGHERLVFRAPGPVGLHDISRNGRILLIRGVPASRMMAGTVGSQKETDLSWFGWSSSADISVDGQTLLFYERGPAVSAVPTTYVRKMDRSDEPVRLGEGKALALSPDRKWALTLQERIPAQLVLLPTGPGEPKPLPRGRIQEYHYASWFADGKQILFTGAESGHALRSYYQDISGGEPQPITQDGIVALSVSPDGKRLVVLSPDGRYYLSPLDGGEPMPVRGLERDEIPIQWSSDSQVLYARGSGDSNTRIYRIELSNGHRELVREIAPDPVGLIGLEVKPGGIQVAQDGKSYLYTYWIALRDLFLAEGLK